MTEWFQSDAIMIRDSVSTFLRSTIDSMFCSVENELRSLAVGFPSDVKMALDYVYRIAFQQCSVDEIANVFCERCGYERELKPLLAFVLDNHFGGKKSFGNRLDALKREQDLPYDNVIQVVMTMLQAAFSRADSPLIKYSFSQPRFDFLSFIRFPVADFATVRANCSAVSTSPLCPS